MGRDVAVGLLDLLGCLLLQGEQSTLLGGDGITELVDDVLLVAGNTCTEGGTRGGHLLLQVSLGNSGGRLDGVEHLLAHLSAGSFGLQVELGNLGVDVLGKSRNLGGDTLVERGTSLLVDALHLLLNLEGTLLTLVDGVTHGRLELGLVVLGNGTETCTASSILNVVLHNNTSEVLDLTIVLGSELGDSAVETSDTGGEAVLGRTEGRLGIELGTA